MPTIDSKTTAAITKAQKLDDSKTVTTAKPRARKLQQIFDAVIDAGHYGSEFSCTDSHFVDRYMCNSLEHAVKSGAITETEQLKAQKAITNYGKSIKKSRCLTVWLQVSGLPFEFKNTLAIYHNWAKRPKLTNKVYLSCN